eukprot:7394128-Pyramimonas_sp.AAC.1
MFPARRVVAPPACPGPGGGWAGGVATILSQEYELINSTALVPGCAIAATVRKQDHTLRVASVYLPPDRRSEVLAALAGALAAPDGVHTYWGGDINMEWQGPRDGEIEDVASWVTMLNRHAPHPAPTDGPARI